MIGFLIWSAVFVLILAIAAVTWRSRKPAAFFAGVEPPEVRDVRKYNRAVAVLWTVYGLAFEGLGIPLLFPDMKVAMILVPLLGVPLISIALMIAYHAILRREEKPQRTGDPSLPE